MMGLMMRLMAGLARLALAWLAHCWRLCTLPREPLRPGDRLEFGRAGVDPERRLYFTWAWGVRPDGRKFLPK